MTIVVKPMILYQPKTYGRTSSRVFNLICDREVWKKLLSGFPELTMAKVTFFLTKG